MNSIGISKKLSIKELRVIIAMDEHFFNYCAAARVFGVHSKSMYQHISSIESKLGLLIYEKYKVDRKGGKKTKKRYTKKGKILAKFAYEVVDMCNALEVELYYSDEGNKNDV